eukprot:m.225345 g.225345  ORF g.225345 m.225345 type:complete len:59 (-) comp33460_c0_seq2:352-528(-)
MFVCLFVCACTYRLLFCLRSIFPTLEVKTSPTTNQQKLHEWSIANQQHSTLTDVQTRH